MPKSFLGINRLVTGPRGLIDFLELRLGLAPAIDDHTSRLLQYREALRVAGEGNSRFYSDSFAVDPFGSSKVLLRWRDELRLNGWQAGLAHTAASRRLQDMADVEQVFNRLAAGDLDEADRLTRIFQALKKGADPGFEQFDLLETSAHFPLRWRQVLEYLQPVQDAFPLPDSPLAEPGSRLHTMQAELLKKPDDGEANDESILIVEGPVLSKNADAAAAMLARYHSDAAESCLISDPTDLESLDRAVRNLDAPSVGSGSRSSLGALVQLAPVLLRLHWGPFNPQAWLEFFLHPVRPLSPKLAGNLAFAVNQFPSRLNPSWQNAIEKTISGTEDSEEKKRLKKQVKDWLSPQEFSEQAKSEVLETTMGKLSEWLAKRGAFMESDKEKSTWLAAAGSVKSLARSIASVPEVTREDLERIIAEWLPGAASGESRPPELGSPQRLASPGHLLEPVDHLVWWQPREAGVSRQPWTRPETEWLAENGITFPDHELLTKTAQKRSHRAVLQARKSLTIFHCPRSGSMDAVLSPLAVRLAAQFGEDIMRVSEDLIETEEVAIQPLPSHREFWQISCADQLTPRENESFSSLSKFIYSPWDWVLNYKARLRAGPQIDCRIVDDARRQGSLLHGFVESLLEPEPDPLEVKEDNLPGAGKDTEDYGAGLLETLVRRLFDENASISWKGVSRDVVMKWVETHWEEILSFQAAHYLVPGNEASRSELLYLAKNAIWELLQQLQAAKIDSVTCEEKITDIPFCGGNIGGFIDLKVTNESGGIGLIDLKLGGITYRREELLKGRHLQLAVYGHLVKTKYGKDAHCAYFIFSGGGKMLARTPDFFPKAEVVFPKSGSAEEEWHECWLAFEKLWSIRRGQLDSGRIELQPSFDLGNWAVPEPSKYSDYLNLVGWDETA